MIARVQPLTRTRAVRGPFDYRLTDDQSAGVVVGSLLRIPFGAQRALGVVVELAERSELEPERLAVPEEVLGVGVGADLVALAHWMAREYCSTPARALSLMLAPGAAGGTGARRVLVAELTPDGHAALGDDAIRLTDGQRALLTTLRDGGPAVAATLGTGALRRLQTRGLVAMEPRARGRRPVSHAVGAASALAPPLTDDQRAVLDTLLAALAERAGPASRPRTPDFCCRGSPDRARPRSTWERWRRRSPPAARRSCSCRRSR